MFKRHEKIDNSRSLITNLNPKSPISEQYRTIRTTLDFKLSDQNLTSFLVTSSEAGVGKSTTIANLAITFAQQGKKVLLVDADLRKPSVHTTFKINNRIGLTNVLTHQIKANEAMQKTDFCKDLTVISSGPIPPNPAELLSSAGMKKFIAEMSQEYEVILFDTPPLNAVTDAQIISRLVGGVVLVARAYQTRKDNLIKAKKLLEQINANILGVVIHGIETTDTSYYYYYGAE